MMQPNQKSHLWGDGICDCVFVGGAVKIWAYLKSFKDPKNPRAVVEVSPNATKVLNVRRTAAGAVLEVDEAPILAK